VPRAAVEAVHLDQIREHGGLAGLRDEHALEAALARPRQKLTYERRWDLATLAAAYAFGIMKNHPFHDGNKRVGFLTAVMFLELNGSGLAAEESEVVTAIVSVAAGGATEADLARWFRVHLQAGEG
jgi:death-on-curing protein